MKKMHIDKYTSYFHDGMIHDINHEKDNINFFMQSAQLLPEWNTDHLVLSKRDTLSGILHLENIKSIHINGQPLNEPLKKTYDAVNIYHIEIKKIN